jgi:hypothetical protein
MIVSICITNLGTQPLVGIFDIYAAPDFSNPILSDIPGTSLSGNSCPYNLSVPDGTTTIRVRDRSGCSIDVPVTSNDICINCDFGLSSILNTQGRIDVGSLTGSCQNPITDYRIYWYGPDDDTTLAYTSGFGTAFSPYTYTHPLSSNNAIVAFGGNYKPVIDKVRINGIDYSQTANTGNVFAELNCLPEVFVSALTCTDVTNTVAQFPFSNYTHRLRFQQSALNTIPGRAQTTIEINQPTSYLPILIAAEQVSDTLKIYFSGSAYSTPILLENLLSGEDINYLTQTFSPNSNPKRYSLSFGAGNTYYRKVISLTGLTVNLGDKILLEVIPNSANTQSNWTLYCRCLSAFTQNMCQDTFLEPNIPYKLILSSLSADTVSCGCGGVRWRYGLSGCSVTQKRQGDPYKYMQYLDQTLFAGALNNSVTGFTQCVSNGQAWCGNPGAYFNQNCKTPSGNTIIYTKTNPGGIGTPGNINIQFSNFTDLKEFWDDYYSRYSSFSGTPFDNTKLGYYRWVTFRAQRASNFTNCGDGVGAQDFNIHFSSVVTSGFSGGYYFMNLTMPIVTNGIPFVPCLSCQDYAQTRYVNPPNNSSTAITNNISITSYTGSRSVQPFTFVSYMISGITGGGTQSLIGRELIAQYSNFTYAYTGTNNTIVPSLSAITSSLTNFTGQTQGGIFGDTQYEKDMYYYEFYNPNPAVTSDWCVRTSPIINYAFSGYVGNIGSNYYYNVPPPGRRLKDIYCMSGGVGTIYDPNYFV